MHHLQIDQEFITGKIKYETLKLTAMTIVDVQCNKHSDACLLFNLFQILGTEI